MADITINDNGMDAMGKVNDKLATSITSADTGSSAASQVNSAVYDGYISSSDNGSDFAAKIAQAEPGQVALRLLTLNVGHYADGKSSSPSFTPQTYADYVERFNAIIDYIDADIVCVQEYSAYVYQQNAAKDVLFGKYPYFTIGTIDGYLGNAFFTKRPHNLVRQQTFAHSNSSGRYFQLFEVEIGGHTIGIVNAHLDTTNNGSNYRNSQFGEIVDALKGYEFALFGSDSNVARVTDDGLGSEQWNVINDWVNGGTYDLGNVYGTLDCGEGYGGGEYTLANKSGDVFLGTWPTTRTASDFSGYTARSCPCDNFAVKGFNVTGVHVLDSVDVPSNDITDHCAFYCDVVIPSEQ